MSDIIEKLGIPLIVSFKDDRGLFVCNRKPVRELEHKYAKILEALIEMEIKLENEPGGWGYFNEMMRSAILKACPGKTWEQIKELDQ